MHPTKLALFFILLSFQEIQAQDIPQRKLRYTHTQQGFVITNGEKRFNRALYGSNTGFRVETGDLPEFALYMPGFGGNISLGIISGNTSKWLNKASTIRSEYIAGSMNYEITDSLLGKNRLFIKVLATASGEGILVEARLMVPDKNLKLLVIYGGASNKKFSRNGDIGADPESSFYLKPENCATNRFSISKNTFSLWYGSKDADKSQNLAGFFPAQSKLFISNVPVDLPSKIVSQNNTTSPVLAAIVPLSEKRAQIFSIYNPQTLTIKKYNELKDWFASSENNRMAISGRMNIATPDSFLNNLGGTLAVAADGIWDGTSYQHGAIAWRMPLNGWRGAYVADPLGWHNRAQEHFRGYAKAQYTEPDSGPNVPDTARNLARQTEKEGVSLFTSGYISRNLGKLNKPHHYDMNLVFIDQLLTHFKWTGDTAFLREMWPVIIRHLAWEKRNFDADNDGLYDAYCCIWASDALQYSGGGVTHSSAYNYRANLMAAYLAPFIGKNPAPYKAEADKIRKAIETNLWLKQGWYGEFKDWGGLQKVHPAAGLWTIYHTLDSEVPDAFEAYQTLRYVDTQIPHIPVEAKGIDTGKYKVLSTTNWMPYTWSINNVVFAENLHTSLAYWQGNRNPEAFNLFKSSVLDAMYLGSSPGNFVQISYYDPFRGELYRDFADPIGIASRTIVEGLFGIKPDLLSNSIQIKPGFPGDWDHASISIPDISYQITRKDTKETYQIFPGFNRKVALELTIPARFDAIKYIRVNQNKVMWHSVENAIETPLISINYESCDSFRVEIEWEGSPITHLQYKPEVKPGENLTVNTVYAELEDIFDPQGITSGTNLEKFKLTTRIDAKPSYKTFFVKVNQNQVEWWEPVNIEVPEMVLKPGSKVFTTYTPVDISKSFNDKVTQIFKNKYLTPRPASPTLQLPTQGIGNWCYPNVTANIDDTGVRAKAGSSNVIKSPAGIPFQTPGDTSCNVVYTSLWDNYPDSVTLKLTGSAAHAYLLMVGSTNPMQSRFVNGVVYFVYTDGTSDSLQLINPETWWPIEQDYYTDNFAFRLNAPKPWRLELKTGNFYQNKTQYSAIKGFTETAIEGGAATMLDLPLKPDHTLQKIVLKTTANDVVIGLMSVTLAN